ncbi:hypothetical protein HPP92_001295 [Vanilla planifolia]|uniref:Uncharacterized protein n=1 Tax=Vanilla planifolia TaxID=51239 RepID=A0A835S290_VANPL|nr:hypothetical protein HPP92_001295 [Vanilla planifolia]
MVLRNLLTLLKCLGNLPRENGAHLQCSLLEFLKLLLHLLRLLQKPMVSLKNIFLDGLYYHHLKDKCRNATSALGNIVPLSIIDDICVCIGDLLMSTRILQRTETSWANFGTSFLGDEAKELVSLKGVNLEELSGSSVIKALTTWKRRPAILTSLPHLYVKAGLTLLDIIQASPSVFPVTSHELFSVLDDASENTFLCAGTALSVQKYVFDGEAVKSALEIQNLVAFTSFLIEKELVKAWLADKDAEALRCQKLLVEEEEAAKKRQADLLEAKRLKKLRVKGQKTKDTSNIMDAEFKSVPIESTSETSTNQQQQILYHSELSIGNEEIKLRLPLHENCCEKSRSFIELNANENFSPHGVTGETSPKLVFPSEEAAQDMVCKTQRENDHQQQYSLRHAYLQARNLGSAFWDHQTSSVYKRHDNRDPKKPVTPPNGLKVWTKKIRPANVVVNKINYNADIRPSDQLDTFERNQVLIGSINVTLKNSDGQHQYTILRPQMEMLPKPVSTSTGKNRTAAKLWRRVTQNGNSNSIQNGNPDSKVLIPFSSEVAKAFLAQRWKEALNGEHVVFSSETPASCADSSAEEALQAVKLAGWEGNGRPEKRFGTAGLINSSSSSLNHKIKTKKDWSKYIPKQKSFEA